MIPQCLQRLGANKLWWVTKWGDCGRRDLSGVVAGSRSDAGLAVQRPVRQYGEALCAGTERQTMGSSGAEVECGAFHRLSDGDYATLVSCVRSSGDITTYW